MSFAKRFVKLMLPPESGPNLTIGLKALPPLDVLSLGGTLRARFSSLMTADCEVIIKANGWNVQNYLRMLEKRHYFKAMNSDLSME